jgi:hypothetical protein
MGRPKLTPEVAYNLAVRLYAASEERDARLESVLAQDPKIAYDYAYDVLFCDRFLAGEPAIMQIPRLAYAYACNMLKAPWPEAESVIAQDAHLADDYSYYVLKTPEDKARFREVQRWVALG